MRIRWKDFELPTKVEVEKETYTNTYGKFIVEPFERGFGHTIGNSLRRVLLSSLEGVAPFKVSIEGVAHEFTAMDGVYEDVTHIILNLKKLVLKMTADDVRVLKIEKKGPCDIKAGDIQTDHTVEILNPDLHIATLTTDRVFKAEIYVKKGRGYVPSEEHAKGSEEPNMIFMDSIFSPVVRVCYDVEATRVGRKTNYDRLILQIWTNGAVTPAEAMIECAIILRKHLNPFIKYTEPGEEVENRENQEQEPQKEEKKEENKLLSEDVSVLNPSIRVLNSLKEGGINTIGELVSRTEDDLLKLRNFGNTSLEEIKQKLAEKGLSLGMKTE